MDMTIILNVEKSMFDKMLKTGVISTCSFDEFGHFNDAGCGNIAVLPSYAVNYDNMALELHLRNVQFETFQKLVKIGAITDNKNNKTTMQKCKRTENGFKFFCGFLFGAISIKSTLDYVNRVGRPRKNF